MNKRTKLFYAISLLALIFIALVSFHSVEEIHYLKGFYPRHFTVTEAASAAWVELIKVLLVAFPFMLGYHVLRDMIKDGFFK